MFKFTMLFVIAFFSISIGVSAQTNKDDLLRLPILMENDATSYISLNNYAPLPANFNVQRVGSGMIVPFELNYTDYATNGNSLQKITVKGDTIIVAISWVDSLDAGNANAGTVCRIRYNYSLDGGATWQSTNGIDMSTNKSRWADMYMITQGGLRTVATGGRFFDPGTSSTRHAGVSTDAILGLGSNNVVTLPETSVGNSDMFIHLRQDGNLGTIYSPNSTDSMVYRSFDVSTSSFGPRTHLYAPNPTLGNTVSSYTIGSSLSGNHMTVAYCYINEPANGGDNYRSQRVQFSSDNGTTWTAPEKWGFNASTPNVIAGDSCQTYWHQDIGYKPGTEEPYLVFSTYPYVWDGAATQIAVEENKGWKICIQSPNLNGGAPVAVADWNNIEILSNLTLYNDIRRFQVNSAFLSHPSVGFSDDGNTIYVTYSVIQKDTSTISIPGAERYYNYFDVYLSMSQDGGATWSTPMNITNTPEVDEMYPVVSETGNNGTAHVVYHSTTIPGSQNFGPAGENPESPTARVYEVYNAVDVGVTNISTEIPEGYSLKQNYPNPFNPSTTIRFDIPKTTKITLKVYDINGREVATLVKNENVSAGLNEVSFNGSNFASGVYYYTLVAGDFKETKKMVLIK